MRPAIFSRVRFSPISLRLPAKSSDAKRSQDSSWAAFEVLITGPPVPETIPAS
jgi:hypothetical protein